MALTGLFSLLHTQKHTLKIPHQLGYGEELVKRLREFRKTGKFGQSRALID